jgi:hypothetical protein
MPIAKDRISSPLEAGSSLLDAKQLPAQLTSALEYVSSRLSHKKLHLSLIVVRKDANMPSALSPATPQRTPSPTLSATSPAGSIFSTTSTLSKHSSQSSLSDCSSTSSTSSLSRTKWPGLPSSPKDINAAPLYPYAPSSPSLSSPTTPTSPNPYGISLMHACTLTPKAEKILRQTISKAEKKFPIGSGWLSSSPLTHPIVCPRTNDLIRRSITQNEVLFSSEGLTLLSIDHVYTFKCQLHTYSRTLSGVDFSSAVDELRRLVLAQHGRRITKGYLMRAYEWLGVSLAALVDVNEGYKTAYGGIQRHGGIEVQSLSSTSPPPLKTNFTSQEVRKMTLSIPTISTSSPVEADLVAFGESAKGRDGRLREDRGPHRRGPVTPNGFEDITPVTKGEWCFLMVGEGWKEGRTVAVETC